MLLFFFFRCSQIPATFSGTSAPSTWEHGLTRVLNVARPLPPRQVSNSISTSTAVSNPLSVSKSLWQMSKFLIVNSFHTFFYCILIDLLHMVCGSCTTCDPNIKAQGFHIYWDLTELFTYVLDIRWWHYCFSFGLFPSTNYQWDTIFKKISTSTFISEARYFDLMFVGC